MAGSPSGSSSATSPHSERRLVLLRQEADAFSDDSGVDLKPARNHGRPEEEDKRRHKRKSSEPKRRKDVLLMKRFRWEDTDEEEDVRDFEEEDEDAFDVQRPGSGDSGCTPDDGRTPPPRTDATNPAHGRSRGSSVREEEDEDDVAACRQSVIRKNESSTTTTTTPLSHPQDDASPGPRTGSGPSPAGTSEDPRDEGVPGLRCGGRPRNYKSMSRQRRIEANARERTRVHTISAAFESLRRAVPAYAHNQKLSKLAILRIASAYIVALACLNGDGREEEDEEDSSVARCVERCTRTLQAEGRSRRRTSKD